MNAATDEDRFEDTLRQLMMQGRPAAAPGTLRDRVMRLPDDHPLLTSRSRNAWVLGAARAAAVLVIVATAGVLLVVGLSTVPPDTGGPLPTAPPPPTRFDPSIDGVGIVGVVGDTRSWLPWIIAVVIGAGGLGLSLRFGRVWRLVGVAAASAMLAVAYIVTTQPGLAWFNASGAPLGIEIEEAPDITNGPDAYHITAEPNQNFMIAFNVENEGSLPIRVLGVVDHYQGMGTVWVPRWTALGIQTDPGGGFGGIAAARPFEPIDLAPGGVVNFYLVGRATVCAVGSSGSPSTAGVGLGPVEVAFTMLGMPDTSEIDLPFVVAEAQRDDCPRASAF